MWTYQIIESRLALRDTNRNGITPHLKQFKSHFLPVLRCSEGRTVRPIQWSPQVQILRQIPEDEVEIRLFHPRPHQSYLSIQAHINLTCTPSSLFRQKTSVRMPSNTAAWLTEAKKNPLEVKEAPTRTPNENEILVKNHAVAVNPIDCSVQTMAFFSIPYPAILGNEVAGEVVAVGPNVTRFKAGDRVAGHALALLNMNYDEGGFQEYTILKTNLVTEIPDHISFEDAVVLPLCLSTAACGLFIELKLPLPTVPAQEPKGETLLVWGGASCVGSNAIQLARAAGYEVFTTASPKNFAYVQKLGASKVFDYSSSSVKEDVVNALKGKHLAGILDSIGFAATPICLEIAKESEGFKFVATTKPRFPTPPEGVQIKHLRGDDLFALPLGKAIYENFLPAALKSGSYITAPKPTVIGKGLEHVQAGVDIVGKGVSATKIVIKL
jgi:NADPH:quinone reductase-like Zn-dependent oxidoreductase